MPQTPPLYFPVVPMLKFVIPLLTLERVSASNTCTSADFEELYYGENSNYGYYLAMNCLTNSSQPVALVDAKACFATYIPVNISDGCYNCIIAKQAALDNCNYSVCPQNGEDSNECNACYDAYSSTYFGDGDCMNASAWFESRNNDASPTDFQSPDITRTNPELPTPMTGEEISTACSDSDFITFWKQTNLAAALYIRNCIDQKTANSDITSTDILECFGDYDSTPLSVNCRECLAYSLNVYSNCQVICSNDPNGNDCLITCPQLEQTLSDNHECIGSGTDPKVLALYGSSIPSSGANSVPSVTSIVTLIAIAIVVLV